MAQADPIPYVAYMTKDPLVLAINPACQGDPFYRYKMRQLVVQTVGHGKMVRTMLTNIDDVSKDLHLPPSYIPNYFAKAIGAQAKYDEKKPERERGSVSGEYDCKKLSDLLVQFIREFVLCPKCNYPEISYSSSGPAKKARVGMKCRSCGWKGALDTLDINEKFKRFVSTHPPPKSTIMKERKEKTGDATSSTSRDSKAGKAAPSANGSSKKEEIVWSSDLSAEAMENRRKEMVPERLKALIVDEDSSKANKTPVERLLDAVAQQPSNEGLMKDIGNLATEFTMGETQRTTMVCEAIFSDLKTVRQEVKKRESIFETYVAANSATQITFLSILEKAVAQEKDATAKADFLKKAPMFLKGLYDEELLDEEPILEWFTSSKSVDKAFRKAVQPFCQWLKEAEEDGSEEEEEEEEVAEPTPSKLTKPVAPSSSTSPAASSNGHKHEDDEETEDLDDEIDAL